MVYWSSCNIMSHYETNFFQLNFVVKIMKLHGIFNGSKQTNSLIMIVMGEEKAHLWIAAKWQTNNALESVLMMVKCAQFLSWFHYFSHILWRISSWNTFHYNYLEQILSCLGNYHTLIMLVWISGNFGDQISCNFFSYWV